MAEEGRLAGKPGMQVGMDDDDDDDDYEDGFDDGLSQWEMSSLSGKIHANKAKSLRPLPSYISFPLEFEGVEE